MEVHLASQLHHRQPTQITRNKWFNSIATWLLKPKLAGVRPFLQARSRSWTGANLWIDRSGGHSGTLDLRIANHTRLPHDQCCLLEQRRIYQNRINRWACPSNLKCWYNSKKTMQNKLEMEFVWSNLIRVVGWHWQRRIHLGYRYPRESLLTCRG